MVVGYRRNSLLRVRGWLVMKQTRLLNSELGSLYVERTVLGLRLGTGSPNLCVYRDVNNTKNNNLARPGMTALLQRKQDWFWEILRLERHYRDAT